MYSKKSLGQHFLTSESAVDKIIDAGDVVADDIVLEVGPGRGMLTTKLLASCDSVIAVEKDDALFELLQEKFKKEIQNKKLNLIHGDILEFKPNNLEAKSYKLIANIPYNITGVLIRKFLETHNQPERMVLMLQKEVAERIVARDKKESIISISVKTYGEPKYVQTVKAGSFSPAPKVDSAILLVENISKNFFKDFSEKQFFEILRAGFKSKRKKLSSNLSEVVEKKKVLKAFEELKFNQNLRAEDLNLDGWKQLVSRLI
jgi:16S rRNA (adenine1518-N6/adenine1519-N6)-dimethyltransferase